MNKNCPAFWKKCLACGKMNRFASQRLTRVKVNVVESENESEVNEYCLTLESEVGSEEINAHASNKRLGIREEVVRNH